MFDHRHPITTFEILKWVARVSAAFMFAFFMLFAVAEGMPPVWRQPLAVQLEFVAFGVIFVGYALGWRHAGAGGATALTGFLLFNVVELIKNGHFAGGAFPLFIIPALFYLSAWYFKTHVQPTHHAHW
jgi:hypothetical protein